MRRALLSLAALTATVALSACGKGGALPGHDGGPPPAAQSSSAAPTARQLDSFAAAVNLRASDLRGFKATPNRGTEDSSERDLNGKLARCAGSQLFGRGGERSSPRFSRAARLGEVSVASSVSVTSSAAAASQQLRLLQSSRTKACVAHYVELDLRGQTASSGQLGHVSIESGTPPAPGASGSFAWRVSGSFHIRGLSLPFYMDFLGFTRGAAEVELTSFALPVPFPARGEEDLFRLLLARSIAWRG